MFGLRLPAAAWALVTGLAFLLLLPSSASAQVVCIEEVESRLKALSERRETYGEALALAQDFEQVASGKFGADSECHARALSHRGALLLLHGRLVEAGPVLERTVAIYRYRARAVGSRALAEALNNLGMHRYWMRQYADAARLHEEALDLRRNGRPLDELEVARSLHNLADAYRYLGHDARPLYQQSLDIRRRLLRPDDWQIGQSLQNLAAAQEVAGDFKSAEANLAAALAIYLKSRPDDHSQIASVTSRLAVVLFTLGRSTHAESQFREALRRHRAAAGAQKLALAATLDDFVVLLVALGWLDEARSLASEALAIRQAQLPPNHPTTARTLSNLSDIALRQGKLGEALDLSSRAKDMTVTLGGADTRSRFILQRHVKAAWSVFASPGSAAPAELLSDAFIAGQRAVQTPTALTVSRMIERFAATDARLRDLLKKIDDIDREQVALDQTLIHTFSHEKGTQAFSETRARLATNQERRARVVAEAKAAFPALFRLVTPSPMGVGEVQALLAPDEVLLSVMAGFQEVYVWAITREKADWRRARLTAAELEDAVKTLRAGLSVDPDDAKQAKLPLFNLGLAHELYAKVLGEVAPLLKGKQSLLVATSGPMTSIPLHLLVTRPPPVPQPARGQPEAYQTADWLVRTHAVAVLPAVESLEARRRPAHQPAERKPLIGFANPLPGTPSAEAPTKYAVAEKTRGGLVRRRSASRGGPAGLWRGASINYAALRKHLADVQLPGTEDELKAVAASLGAAAEDLRIGPAATETAVKEARLSDYRIVYFATHGYVAGTFGQGEPALALTVPEAPSETDDGLLTASEIAQLSLAADWVVLSACDTAAGASKGADGLSGLARAFFHAGARSLLVSHWPVSDLDTKQLMIATFGAIRDDAKIGRAEALRRAMLKQIAAARPREAGVAKWNAYPANWAPFDLVAADPN